MKRIAIIAIIIASIGITLSSCTGSRGGCYSTRGMSGYGH